MKSYSNKYEKMTQAPVKGLIRTLAIPTIITMLVSALYNMADSYFVGKIDTSSVAAIGIVFSIMTMLQAIGFCLGQGSGVCISSYLGAKDKEKAQTYASVAFYISIIIGILLAIFGFFFSSSIAKIMGATATTLENTKSYLKIILLGSPFILGSFVMNNQLRYQGSAIYSMFGILSGSLLNIALDPLLIFKLNLGVKGAAYATIISQFIGFIILIIGTFKGENIKLYPKYFKPKCKVISEILKNGIPSLSRQGIQTIANITLNFAASQFGDEAIAGMSVFNRVMFLGFAVVIGIGQGFQPVSSFNNGAKRYDRVYEGYKYTILLSTCFITFAAIIEYIFAPNLITLFRNDPIVIDIGKNALRYECFVLPLIGFCTASNMLTQSLKLSGRATIMALCRQGIFYIPLMLTLPRILGLTGLELVQPMAELFTFITTIFLTKSTIKNLKESIKS